MNNKDDIRIAAWGAVENAISISKSGTSGTWIERLAHASMPITRWIDTGSKKSGKSRPSGKAIR
jgi:hypothetical protein